MKRALKVFGIVLILLVAVAIALPFLIDVNAFRPRLESDLSTALGRQVKVGNLKLALWSGSVAAEQISIADDPAFSTTPFVQAKSLNVGVELMPLILSKQLHVTELTLDQPQISLVRSADGRWNFSSIGANAAKPAPQAKQPESFGSDLSVAKLNINNGRVMMGKTPAAGRPHVYDKVNITVHNFSFTSQFPFTLTANLPAGGNIKLDGKAGPINAADAALTPLQAKVKVSHLDLAAAGFVDASSGVAGVADFDGTLSSDGKLLRTGGTLKADKLKLVEKGSPANRPVEVKYALIHNLEKQSGNLNQGELALGKAIAHLTGSYELHPESVTLNMKLVGDNMAVDELEAMLPALGIILPPGSSLKGGTLSTTLAITGPADKPTIAGPIRLANTKLAGFDLGSKMSAISALSGTKTGSDTSIQNLSTDARVAPEGIRTDNLMLLIPALGEVSGAGTISPGGALDYKMSAKLNGGAVTGVAQLAGFGGKTGGAIPFFIRGTTSNPSFVPDVQGILKSQLKSNLPGGGNTKSTIDALSGLFGKKKKK